MARTGHAATAFSITDSFAAMSAPGLIREISVTSKTAGATNSQAPQEIHPGIIRTRLRFAMSWSRSSFFNSSNQVKETVFHYTLDNQQSN